MARTHKFATETVDLPAQEGERVTIAVAAPSTVYREVGPLKFSPKSPDFYSGEPLCLTNHRDGRESLLLRAPAKNEGISLLNPSVLFPLFAVLGTGNAASGMIDPSMPQLISVAVVSSFALGVTLNTLVIPQLGRVCLSNFPLDFVAFGSLRKLLFIGWATTPRDYDTIRGNDCRCFFSLSDFNFLLPTDSQPKIIEWAIILSICRLS